MVSEDLILSLKSKSSLEMPDRTQGSNVYCFSRGGKKTAMVNWPRFSLNRGCCTKAISFLFFWKEFCEGICALILNLL
jgi:hypothetical protein